MSFVETAKNVAFDSTVGMLVGGGSALAAGEYSGHIFTALPNEPENRFATGAVFVASVVAVSTIVLALLRALPFTKGLYTKYCDENKKPYLNLLLKSGVTGGVAAGAIYGVPFLNDLLSPREQLIGAIVAPVFATVLSTTVKGYFTAGEATKPAKTK